MCNGMQIRSHAAAALVNLGQRDLYEGQLEEALRVFCDAAAGLQGNSMPGQDFAESGMLYSFICLIKALLASILHGNGRQSSRLHVT